MSALGATVCRMPGNVLKYTPSAIYDAMACGQTLTDTFEYRIRDRHGDTSIATVTVTLTKPVPQNQLVPLPNWATVMVGQTVSIPVLLSSILPRNTIATVQILNVQGGTATVNHPAKVNGLGDVTVDFTAGNTAGLYSLKYRLAVGDTLSVPATIYLSVLENASSPAWTRDIFITPEDEGLTISKVELLGANTAFTIQEVFQCSNGAVSLTNTGDCVFSPKGDFNGTAIFKYRATAGSESVTKTVMIHVLAVEDAPVAGNFSTTTYPDRDIIICLSTYASDADGDHLQFMVNASALRGTLTPLNSDGADGFYRYTPSGLGSDTFTYTATDLTGRQATATVTVNVQQRTPNIEIATEGIRAENSMGSIAYYTPLIPIQRDFVIRNTGSDVLQLDLSALREMALPAGVEIIHYPDETVEAGCSTTLSIRFDGSGDVGMVFELGTNVPDNDKITFSHQELSAGVFESKVADFTIADVSRSLNNFPVGTVPQLQGTVYTHLPGYTFVQFDLNNNTSNVEREVLIANHGDSFAVDVSNYFTPDSYRKIVRYRICYEIGVVRSYDAWKTYEFYLDPNPVAGSIRVDDLKITSVDDAGVVRFDPYVIGKVNGAFVGRDVKVQFAHTSNASTPLATISIGQTGEAFRYDPWAYDAAFVAPKNGTGKVYYRLVVDGVAQGWQTYALTYPNISGSLTVNFKTPVLATKNNIAYVTDASREVYISGSSTENIYTAVRWDTNGDGIYDQVSEHLLGKNLMFLPQNLPHDTLMQLRGTPYFWSETHQLWVPGTTWTSGNYVVTSSYLNSLTDTSDVPSDSPLRYAITGSLSNAAAAQKAYVKIAIDKDGDDIPDAYVYTDADGKFMYIPTDWTLGNYTVRAAVCVEDVVSSGTYAWTSTYYQCVLKPTSLRVKTLKLSSEVNYVSPNFAGTMDESKTYDGYIVEFDHNNDGVAEGRVIVNEDGTFTYLAAGAADSGRMYYRVGKWNSITQDYLFNAWTYDTYTFTLPVLKAGSFELVNPTVSSSRTTDPTIRGKIEGNRDLAYRKVEIDTNQDGIPDAFVYTDAEGAFVYTPENLPTNRTTYIRARVVDWNYTTQQESPGAWSSYFSFYLEGVSAPGLGSPELLYDTGSTTRKTSIPILTGTVSSSNGYKNTVVEFYTKDTQGNRTVLGQTTPNSSGRYYWTASLETNVATTIYVQAKTRDAYLNAWPASTERSITITYDPSHDNLATFSISPQWIFPLTNTNSRATTATPYLQGRVNNDGDKTLVDVEFRIAAGGTQSAVTLGVAHADADGYFSFGAVLD